MATSYKSYQINSAGAPDADPEAKKKAQLLISNFRTSKESKATKKALSTAKNTHDNGILLYTKVMIFLFVKIS